MIGSRARGSQEEKGEEGDNGGEKKGEEEEVEKDG